MYAAEFSKQKEVRHMSDSRRNILKVRDDCDYIELVLQDDGQPFSIQTEQSLDWCSGGACTRSGCLEQRSLPAFLHNSLAPERNNLS